MVLAASRWVRGIVAGGGVALVLLGVLTNQWLLAALGLPTDVRTLNLIWTFQVLCISIGGVAIGLRRRVVFSRGALALAVVASLASVAAAEWGLRLAGYRPWTDPEVRAQVEPPGSFYVPDTELGYVHRPGQFQLTLPRGHSFIATHDEAGRRVTASAAETSARPELWIFGCSYTYGWSIDDDESYPWLLQAAMPEFEIVNFGVGGYGTLQSLIQLERALRSRFRPSAIVVAYASFHDRRNTLRRGRRRVLTATDFIGAKVFPFARLGVGSSLVRGTEEVVYREWPFTRRSALVNFVEGAMNRLDELSGRSHRVSELLIERFDALAREVDVPFALVGITKDSATDRILRSNRNRGIRVRDISVDLSLSGARNTPHDSHPSAESHRRYALELERFLREVLATRSESRARPSVGFERLLESAS